MTGTRLLVVFVVVLVLVLADLDYLAGAFAGATAVWAVTNYRETDA